MRHELFFFTNALIQMHNDKQVAGSGAILPRACSRGRGEGGEDDGKGQLGRSCRLG